MSPSEDSAQRTFATNAASATPFFNRLHLELQMDILSRMDFDQLTALKRCSSAGDMLVTCYFHDRLDSILTRFVAIPECLREIMRRTHSVISGSCALDFMLATHGRAWEAHDLDVYVPHAECDAVVAHFEHTEGYERAPPFYVNMYDHGGVAEVVRLKKGSVQIDVVRSTTSCALHPLPYFWTTAVINYISADFACSAYPRLTFARCGLLYCMRVNPFGLPTPPTLPLLQKYRERGFDIRAAHSMWTHEGVDEAGNLGRRTGNCPCCVRFFADADTVHTALQLYKSPVVDVMEQTDTTVSWIRGGFRCGPGCEGNGAVVYSQVTDITNVH